MNDSIYLKSLFIPNLLWISVSYPMHLVKKQGMTPDQAVEKCISDCDHRGLKELLNETSYGKCENGGKIRRNSNYAHETVLIESIKMEAASLASLSSAYLAESFNNKYLNFCFIGFYTYNAFQGYKLYQAIKSYRLLKRHYKNINFSNRSDALE